MLKDQVAKSAEAVLSQLSFPQVVAWVERETFQAVEISTYDGYKYVIWLDGHSCGEVSPSDDGECLDLYFQWGTMAPVQTHAHISQFQA